MRPASARCIAIALCAVPSAMDAVLNLIQRAPGRCNKARARCRAKEVGHEASPPPLGPACTLR